MRKEKKNADAELKNQESAIKQQVRVIRLSMVVHIFMDTFSLDPCDQASQREVRRVGRAK